jgi:calcineurin-like phosphoesterase family protein
MKITLNQGQDIFFTSDTHINHKNICRGVSEWLNDSSKGHLRTRDFNNLEEMNSTIIDNINRKVGQDDILVHLGDFSFGGHQHIPEFRQRIVCQNIIFVYGNHDEHIQKNTDDYQSLFSSVHHYLELEIIKSATHQIFGGPTKHNFVLCHFPIASHNNIRKGWMHLHGHVHLDSTRKLGPGKMLDVGVDGNYLTPYSLSEVVSLLKDRPNKSLMEHDHHAD